MAYAYKRTLTVTSSSVLLPSTQTNFPVLVKISDATLKTVGNGGHVQNTVTQASGPAVTIPADLIFTSDALGATKIPWEVDSYDGTAGTLWAWVQISSLALSTVFYCFYGDASVSAAQNTGSFTPANVWISSYKGVWHFGASSILGTDSTSNANNSTALTATATTGQIGGAGSFDGVSKHIDTPQSGFPTGSGVSVTASAWVNFSGTYPTFNVVWGYGGSGTGTKFGFYIDKNAPHHLFFWGGGDDIDTGYVVPTGWIHVVETYNGSQVRVLINGVQQLALTTPSVGLNFGSSGLGVGYSRTGTVDYFAGSIDEMHVSSGVLANDWITAEYNNQNDPTTFITVGAEVPLGKGVILANLGNPGMLIIGGR